MGDPVNLGQFDIKFCGAISKCKGVQVVSVTYGQMEPGSAHRLATGASYIYQHTHTHTQSLKHQTLKMRRQRATVHIKYLCFHVYVLVRSCVCECIRCEPPRNAQKTLLARQQYQDGGCQPHGSGLPIRMYAKYIRIHTFVFVCVFLRYVRIPNTYVYTHSNVCVPVNMYMFVCMHGNSRMCVRLHELHACMHTCIVAFMHACR